MLLIPSGGSLAWQEKQPETEVSTPVSSANYVSALRQVASPFWASIYPQREEARVLIPQNLSLPSKFLLGMECYCVVCAVGVIVPNQRAPAGCSLMITDRGGVL